MIPKILCRGFVFLLMGVGSGPGQITIPDTPTGHTLQAWLDASTGGYRAKVETDSKTVDTSRVAR